MIRISSLPQLLRCPGWWVQERRHPSLPGVAADTGSAAGRLIQLFHETGDPRRAQEEALDPAEVAWRYPRADVERAARLASAYAADPRQEHERVVPGSCEIEVRMPLPCGELVGHIDQVRSNPELRRFEVWDVKSGRGATGENTLHECAAQLAGYAVALGAAWRTSNPDGWPVVPGGVLWLPGYERRGGQVRYAAPWNGAAAESLVAQAVAELARLLDGDLRLCPGTHCSWCPGANIGECVRRFRERPVQPEEIE